MDHVAVFDDVFLAFQTPFTGILGTLLALVLDKVVIADDFGTNKALFEVGMDNTGRLRSGCADLDGPGTYLFYTGGEIASIRTPTSASTCWCAC